MSTIHARIESERGCGYRKPGGMYLVGGSNAQPCCKLPFELSVCPCCGSGIKQARGFTWIMSDIFCEPKPFGYYNGPCKDACPISFKGLRLGLLWVGEKYYPSADLFTREARGQGISKRIAQIPKDLVVGKTWVALAHPTAVTSYDESIGVLTHKPGIFSLFIPQAIEYIVTGQESEDELRALEKRGLTLVKLMKDVETQLEII
jgi:hypothetical protein